MAKRKPHKPKNKKGYSLELTKEKLLAAYGEYAKAINKPVEVLTKEEKHQALFNWLVSGTNLSV